MRQPIEMLRTLKGCFEHKCDGCFYHEKDGCIDLLKWDVYECIFALHLENAALKEKLTARTESVPAGFPGRPLRWWAEQIHTNAVDHGWWDEDRSFGEIVALCHSELSEALEEYRAGRPMEWYACTESEGGHPCGPKDETECYYFGQEETCKYHGEKPEGIAVEMIDCLIRILDWCGKEGIDVDEILARKHEYNKTRPYRHGGKKL